LIVFLKKKDESVLVFKFPLLLAAPLGLCLLLEDINKMAGVGAQGRLLSS
jgi:hypothetical protein